MIETLLRQYQHYNDRDSDPSVLLAALVAAIRPRRKGDVAAATQSLHALCHLLNSNDDWRAMMRSAIVSLLLGRKHLSLYVDAGILPNTGFFSESARRVSHKLLPDAIDPAYLRDVMRLIFTEPDDARWVSGVAGEVWLELFAALRFGQDDEFGLRMLPYVIGQLLEAIQVLSYRISAMGLESELIHVDPQLENVDSAFLAQNVATLSYAGAYAAWWQDAQQSWPSSTHLLVQLGQCRDVINRTRDHASETGTSVHLTFTLERLRQHLSRTESLLAVLTALGQSRTLEAVGQPLVALFKYLVMSECRRNNLAHYWRQNMSVLAIRVTENAKRTGEHYITDNRREYFALLRSALGAGFIIAFMAASKILMGRLHLAPLSQALLYCLNYALGFVLIHMLHFTVATKQPAMTANAIAASIEDSGDDKRSLADLTTLIARTTRSQFAAIFGNILLTVPVAILIAMAWHAVSGAHFVDAGKATSMLQEIDPLSSGAFFYAANAGFCLFLSGLIAGYYDNLSTYNKIPQRLLQLQWPRRWFGEARMQRFAGYVERNLGALAGNFFFGFLLGGMWAIGVLFGLPIDIRHITFSATNVGFALVAFDFHPDTRMLVMGVMGVAVIGLTNLAVSFALALMVALRARSVSFAQERQLASSLWHRLLRRPREFFLPPKN
ncbi:site-specific recombinase [Undibacterium arcticum]|uniref:Site-specific recombinase n=1 Tax=Undibacterium arcticum TaxID=1762892 RepID=A0ABV7EZQ4_9BURK